MASVYKTLSADGGRGKSGVKTTTGDKTKSKNAQRVLILSSRGITTRHRHFLNDLAVLLPHGRRESKFDSKKNLQDLNELAFLYNCNNVLFLEARKHKDLYMHMAKAPNGPRAKFHVQSLDTMSELNFHGNCLKGSRPILSFDVAFEAEPHLRLVRELLTHSFGVPPNARKSKPFIDRVLGFTVLDGKIWVRHYEVKEEKEEGTAEGKSVSLVEIGPRFCMTPIFIQEGSFGGPLIYENKQYVSPNQVRADLRRKVSVKHSSRQEQNAARFVKKGELGIRTGGTKAKADELDTKALFAQ